MNRATWVTVDGIEQDLGHQPTLAEAQRLVGSWVELVKVKGRILVVDEEGKLKDKSVNKLITDRYGSQVGGGSLVGDVIVLEGWRTVK